MHNIFAEAQRGSRRLIEVFDKLQWLTMHRKLLCKKKALMNLTLKQNNSWSVKLLADLFCTAERSVCCVIGGPSPVG